MSRKDKQLLKRREREAGRFDTVNNIGDIGDFDELADVKALSDSIRPVVEVSIRKSEVSDDVEKAMRTLKGSESRSKKDQGAFDAFSSMLGEGFPSGKRERRPAPSISQMEDAMDEEENLLESFSKRKREFMEKKKEHYTAEPTYGGVEESVEGKRAASYEIMKNKGLTPHRKKANRNPRVKKREAYEKAIVRRKGQVRDVITGAAAAYGGELTGIKSNIARSRKIGN